MRNVFLFLLVVISGGYSAPSVDSLDTYSGTIDGGSAVTIYGSSFGASQGGGYVKLDGVEAGYTSWSDTQIEITTPACTTMGTHLDVHVADNAVAVDSTQRFGYYVDSMNQYCGDNIGAPAFTQSDTVPTGWVGITSAPCTLDAPGNYILMNDINSDSSAIYIDADSVVLDLNGRRVTYGSADVQATNVYTYNSTKSGNVGHYGIICPSRDDMTRDYAFSWNPQYTDCVVKNGVVTNGDTTGTDLNFSPAINITGLASPVIENVIVYLEVNNSECLLINANTTVRTCTFYHLGGDVENRHAILGTIYSYGRYNNIYKNLFYGAPQTSIKMGSNSKSNHIYQNIFRGNTTATNGYAIQGANGGDSLTVNNNVIYPFNSRGFGIGMTEGDFFNNYLETRIEPNAEYSLLDGHGVKIEKGNDLTVRDNIVLGISQENGPPTPLNFGLTNALANDSVYNNKFIAIQRNVDERSSPLYSPATMFDSASYVGFNNFYSNSRTNTYMIIAGSDGMQMQTKNNGFHVLGNTDTTKFFLTNLYVGQDTGQYHINNYYNEIDVRSYDINAYAPCDTCQFGYDILWDLTLTTPASAQIIIVDAYGDTTINDNADGSGNYVARLKEIMVHGIADVDTLYEYNPYTLFIKSGSDSIEHVLTMRAEGNGDFTTLSDDTRRVLTMSQLHSSTVGDEYVERLMATKTSQTWTVLSGTLPAGLSIEADSITGTPTKAGFYEFTLKTKNGVDSTTKAVSMYVDANIDAFWLERVDSAEANIDPTWNPPPIDSISTIDTIWVTKPGFIIRNTSYQDSGVIVQANEFKTKIYLEIGGTFYDSTIALTPGQRDTLWSSIVGMRRIINITTK